MYFFVQNALQKSFISIIGYSAAFNSCIFIFIPANFLSLGTAMLFQTILQTLLRKKRSVELRPKKELSPMAHNIMQKLADHHKTKEEENQANIHSADNLQNK